MSVHIVTPLESTQGAREQLAKALLKLAEAQVEVAKAASTLAMFEHNWTGGWYVQKDSLTPTPSARRGPRAPFSNTTAAPPLAVPVVKET